MIAEIEHAICEKKTSAIKYCIIMAFTALLATSNITIFVGSMTYGRCAGTQAVEPKCRRASRSLTLKTDLIQRQSEGRMKNDIYMMIADRSCWPLIVDKQDDGGGGDGCGDGSGDSDDVVAADDDKQKWMWYIRILIMTVINKMLTWLSWWKLTCWFMLMINHWFSLLI